MEKRVLLKYIRGLSQLKLQEKDMYTILTNTFLLQNNLKYRKLIYF